MYTGWINWNDPPSSFARVKSWSTARMESALLLLDLRFGAPFPAPWHKLSRRGWTVWYPNNWSTPSCPIFKDSTGTILVSRLCLPFLGRVGWVQEFLKVAFPRLDNIPSPGHQFSSHAEHNLGQALLSVPESVFQNFLEANRKFFSIASLNSANTQVLALATNKAAALLASQHLPTSKFLGCRHDR